MSERQRLRALLFVTIAIGFAGIAKYTNWQTAILLAVVLWANNALQRDDTIRETIQILRKIRDEFPLSRW